MASKNSQVIDASAVIPEGYVTYQGDILSMDGNIVTMRVKKSGSSSYESKVFPKKKVLSIKGGVGKPSIVQVQEPMVFAKFPAAVVEPGTDGFVKVSTDDGVILVREDAIRGTAALSKDEAPSDKLKVEKPMKQTDRLETKRPKKEQTPAQAKAARENLKKADAKNKDKKLKKRDRE